MQRILATLALASLAPLACAQVAIDPANSFAWSENVGWLNFADTPSPDQVAVFPDHLAGFVWGENIGWINLGNGAGPYTNTDNTNYGVNILGTGNLSGYAWGENIGWINFGTVAALGAFNQQARYDALARRFRGYAWGENIGWINLDDATHFVATRCLADWDNSGGQPNSSDFLAYLNDYSSSNPPADLAPPGGNGVFDSSDFLAFLNFYSQGC